METGKAVTRLEAQLVEAVNQSHLHPVVVRLVLLNLLHAVQEQEREVSEQYNLGKDDANE